MSVSPGAGTLIIHSSCMCLWNLHCGRETCPFLWQREGRTKKDTLVIRDGFWPYGICSLIGHMGYTAYTSTGDPSEWGTNVRHARSSPLKDWVCGTPMKLNSAGEKSIAWPRCPQEDGVPSTSHHIDKGTSLKGLYFLDKICRFTPMCGLNLYKYQGFPTPFPSNSREVDVPIQ